MADLAEITRTFARIGLLSFGGPAAQISLMHREIVEIREWVSEEEFLSALSFCMLLPGPEAMQLATWIGWRKQGVLGGLIAGGLFVLPGAVLVLILAIIYDSWGQVPLVAALFTGVQAAVLAVVVEALLRVSKRALKSPGHWAIAALAFVALFVFAAPFPVIILAAALWGFVQPNSGSTEGFGPNPWRESLSALALWSAVWLLPLAAILAFAPPILADIAWFFSKLAVLTFGGAYAVLTWMTQEVVQQKQWLTLPQMIDGLGLAETTPGPLILVTEFAGYLAAARHGVWMGLAGAGITLWMTFAPCFLWIFAGAPWIARLSATRRLAESLKSITAAVVGVIANLSLWFALHVTFATVRQLTYGPMQLSLPQLNTVKLLPLLLSFLAAYLLLHRHWPLPKVLILCAISTAAVAAF